MAGHGFLEKVLLMLLKEEFILFCSPTIIVKSKKDFISDYRGPRTNCVSMCLSTDKDIEDLVHAKPVLCHWITPPKPQCLFIEWVPHSYIL